MEVLNFWQAQTAAQDWRKGLVAVAPTTIADLIAAYLGSREKEGMKSVRDTRQRADLHIIPDLGAKRADELTLTNLKRWRDGLVTKPKMYRGPIVGSRKVAALAENDAEAVRKRKDTANRVLTMLKAALSWGAAHELVPAGGPWTQLKPFPQAGARKGRFLGEDEQRRLLAHCNGSLRDLATAALLTGARFGELAQLRVEDFDPKNGSIFVRQSKSAKARHVPLTDDGVTFFRQRAIGLRGSDLLLMRVEGVGWMKSSYAREFARAAKAAAVGPLSFHELRHAYASTLVRNGAPLVVVANALGHSSTAMVEKHYGHLARSFIDSEIRKAAPRVVARPEAEEVGTEHALRPKGRIEPPRPQH